MLTLGASAGILLGGFYSNSALRLPASFPVELSGATRCWVVLSFLVACFLFAFSGGGGGGLLAIPSLFFGLAFGASSYS
jgi:hypothetical protein